MKWPSWIVPRGDWIESYPSTNGKIILGIRLAWLYVVAILVTIIVLLIWQIKTGEKPIPVPEMVGTLFSALGFFIAGVMGISVAQFGVKRATTTPEIVQATSDAAVAKITAEHAVAPQPVGAPHPKTPAGIVAAIEGTVAQQREWIEQLATENRAKAVRQYGTEFEAPSE